MTLDNLDQDHSVIRRSTEGKIRKWF